MQAMELYFIRLWARIFNKKREDNYDVYNAINGELDRMDPNLVLRSSQHYGIIDAYYILYDSSPYLYDAKKLIFRNLPNAMIQEAKQAESATFYASDRSGFFTG